MALASTSWGRNLRWVKHFSLCRQGGSENSSDGEGSRPAPALTPHSIKRTARRELFPYRRPAGVAAATVWVVRNGAGGCPGRGAGGGARRMITRNGKIPIALSYGDLERGRAAAWISPTGRHPGATGYRQAGSVRLRDVRHRRHVGATVTLEHPVVGRRQEGEAVEELLVVHLDALEEAGGGVAGGDQAQDDAVDVHLVAGRRGATAEAPAVREGRVRGGVEGDDVAGGAVGHPGRAG